MEDIQTQETLDQQLPTISETKKTPRKPRPSEIAAKKAKNSGATNRSLARSKTKDAAKKKVKKAAKPKTKKKVKKPTKKKVKKPTKKKHFKKAGPKKTLKRPTKRRAKKARKVHGPGVVRTERLDLRLTKAEKKAMHAKAKKMGRTITSIVIDLIAKFK